VIKLRSKLYIVTAVSSTGQYAKYLFVAIDRATRVLYFEIYENKTAINAVEFLNNCKDFYPFTITHILTDNGLEFTDLVKMTIEAALGAEMEHHLGYAKHEQNTQDIDISNNTRNGYYPKTIKGSHGEVEIFVPRDRSSSFETIIIEKGQTRLGNLAHLQKAAVSF
jgi:IS30 family transposase